MLFTSLLGTWAKRKTDKSNEIASKINKGKVKVLESEMFGH